MKRLIYSLIIAAMTGLGLFVWWNWAISPVEKTNTKPQQFIITRGQSIREIAKNLADQNLIRDPVAFFLLERFVIKDDPQAGYFNLAPAMSATEIARKLTVGTADTWITVPEGWRTSEIVSYLQSMGFSGATPFLDEGYYFPETYSVPKTTTISAVLDLMRSHFPKNITHDQLIIASLVEREAQSDTDRPIVASVIYNRLKAGMALDIDATVQYALGFWKKDLTRDDLKIKSPYNTYLTPGLPPGPICNPGLSAITAAQNPAKTEYYFYISDKTGVMHYAKTLEEHNANIARYLTP